MTALPRMLDDIIVGLTIGEPDLDVVHSGEHIGWKDAIEELHPDVVILDDPDGEELELCRELLYQTPALRFLALSGGVDGPFLYALRPARVPLGDVSPDGLLRALRSQVGADA